MASGGAESESTANPRAALRPLIELLARQAAREWMDEQVRIRSEQSVDTRRSGEGEPGQSADPATGGRSVRASAQPSVQARDILRLPDAVMELCKAQAAVRSRYAATGLSFTLDGKLVGDIGEALAIEAFGLTLCAKRRGGVDATAPDRRTVQVKATGDLKAGPAFTAGEEVADHLLFLQIDFSAGIASVAYNGPEAPVRAMLKQPIKWTQRIRLIDVLAADALVPVAERLKRLGSE